MAAAEASEPWARLDGPSASGYCYIGGRSVMRVQRDKPRGSTTVNCYMHASCKLLLSNKRCPDDITLKRWLFEVGPARPDAPKETRAALAKEHMSLGRSKWSARGQAPQASKTSPILQLQTMCVEIETLAGMLHTVLSLSSCPSRLVCACA